MFCNHRLAVEEPPRGASSQTSDKIYASLVFGSDCTDQTIQSYSLFVMSNGNRQSKLLGTTGRDEKIAVE
jgi:hypothetical protein